MVNVRLKRALVILGFCAVLPLGSAVAQVKKGPVGSPVAAPPAAPANPFVGLWVDHTGDGVVEITACTAPATDKLCGRIVWLRAPNDATGKPLVDGLNEDQALRGRPICGMPVIGNLSPQTDGTYDEGWIYDPRQGKAYSVELRMLAPDQIQVMGYKGVKLFNRKFVWTKSTEQVVRCVAPKA